MSDSDSDDSLLLQSVSLASKPATKLTTADDLLLRRALEESNATFQVEQRRKTYRYNSCSSDEEEELEVSPPSRAVLSKEKGTCRPSLTSSGGSSQDPVSLDDDDDEKPTPELSLKERLAQRLDYSAVPPKLESFFHGGNRKRHDVLELLSSDDEDLKGTYNLSKPAARKEKESSGATTNVSSTASVTRMAFDNSDSSDDDLQLSPVKPRVFQRSRKDRHESSSSEDEDTGVTSKPRKRATATTKHKQQKNQQKAEKQRKQELKRLEREAKQAEKQRLKLEKEQQKRSKKAAEAAEKESKKRRREVAAQGSGKHAKEEIAVLMDRRIFRHATLTLVDDMQEAGYTVQEYPSALGCQAIQFVRKDFIHGGSQAAIQLLHARKTEGFEHLPVLSIVFDDPHEFLKLLDRPALPDGNQHDEDDDYPQLEKWLRGIENGWKTAWKTTQRPRILLLLNNVMAALDKLWIGYRKRRKRDEPPPPTAEELHDATTWMLIQFQVECIHCASTQDISKDLQKMTRMLAEERYRHQVTEFECVKKLKPQCNDMDPELDRAMDCWHRQLQQVPNVSQTIASSLVQYYPTARSLWNAYQNENLTEDQKRLLLVDCCAGQRRNPKVSDMIYRIMTGRDANELLR